MPSLDGLDMDTEAKNTSKNLQSIQVKSGDWIEHSAQLPARFVYDKTQTVDVQTDILEQNRILPALGSGDFTNSYKIMRSQVLQKMRDNDWNTLGVTSPHNKEGKTLTAINLAISLALEVNYTVLLVDANMQKPDVAANFGIDSEYGLVDYLRGDIPMEDLLIHPKGIDRFIILPGGKPVANASETLSSHMMVDFVADVKSRYRSRIVVFDLPPILVAGESLSIAPYIDSMILVVEAGKTKKEDIVRAQELLEQSNLLGTVLSKS